MATTRWKASVRHSDCQLQIARMGGPTPTVAHATHWHWKDVLVLFSATLVFVSDLCAQTTLFCTCRFKPLSFVMFAHLPVGWIFLPIFQKYLVCGSPRESKPTAVKLAQGEPRKGYRKWLPIAGADLQAYSALLGVGGLLVGHDFSWDRRGGRGIAPCGGRSVGRSVGWLVGWLAGWLAGWLVGWLRHANMKLVTLLGAVASAVLG